MDRSRHGAPPVVPIFVVLTLLAAAPGPLSAATGFGSVEPSAPSGPPAIVAPVAEADTVLFVTDTMIPLRDGVRLHARIWRPDPPGEPRPTILSMTPYTLDDAQDYGEYFADRGYVYVNVDVRGRGSSDGEFWPLAQDGPDGADVVGWIADRSWSDGRVLMRGGSYRGMVQWQTLAEDPPEALVSVVPTASVHPGWDYPNPSGIFLSYAARWLGFVQGRASQSSLFGANDYWSARYRILHREGRAFEEMGEVTGISGRVFDRWIEHPAYDEYWRAMNPDSADYARIDVPILTITGHFDGDQPGAMKYYRNHMRHGRPSATGDHHLVVGPWSHGGTRDPSAELGGLTFADTAVIDVEGLHDEWYRWALGEGEKPSFLEDRVVYYVMGADAWRSAPSLEAVSDTAVSFHLASPGGDARDVFHSGRLERDPPAEADVDSYRYDPRDTAEVDPPTDGGYTSGGAAHLEGPKLVYHSPPLDAPLTVAGYMRLEAWIELDVPDTDLAARVYEIRPDGTTIRLGESLLRARYRNGVDAPPELVEPGRVERYVFDRFYWFARELKEGSRLRLVVTPVNTPELDKNYQSGENTITETVDDARAATVRLHLGGDTPSRLVLPVSRGGR
jgi:putative CocE/NonD family hydrolase